MKVEIIAHYNDDTRGIQESHSIVLDSADGESIFKDRWDSFSNSEKSSKLFAYADILLIAQGIRKGFRHEDAGAKQISHIVENELNG